MGLYICDAELASLYHSPPNLRHAGNRHYCACSNEVFDAPDAVSWARAMAVHPPSTLTMRQYFNEWSQSATLTYLPHPDHPTNVVGISDPDNEFTLYTILIGIQAQVCEARELDRLFAPATQHEITTLLLSWYQSYTRVRPNHDGTDNSPLCLMILWHSIFVSLFADINDLEIVFGKNGSKAATDKSDEVSRWASTSGAKRAALHVIRIRYLLSRLSLSVVPPLHVPRIAFQSAIVCWCYIRFRDWIPTPNSAADWTPMASWREFPSAGLNAKEMQRDLRRIRTGLGSEQPLGPFNDILQRLGYWGLSKRLGDILNIAIHDETNMR
jgi:hypothetical protein